LRISSWQRKDRLAAVPEAAPLTLKAADDRRLSAQRSIITVMSSEGAALWFGIGGLASGGFARPRSALFSLHERCGGGAFIIVIAREDFVMRNRNSLRAMGIPVSTAAGAGMLAGATMVATIMAAGMAAAVEPTQSGPALRIDSQSVRYVESLDLLVFEQTLQGPAGDIRPAPRGAMDGAPVLAYVFPTTLSPEVVGFGDVEGILALAATSHPDFDDTPLWDESMDGRYDNDGAVWHAHWVVLGEDARVPGGLSVIEFAEGEDVTVPPTHPDMPMYLDSPGFGVVTHGQALRIIVPAYRVRANIDFRFDAVTAYMEVNTSDEGRPLLGVYEVYDIASGDLSLPYAVEASAAVP
jgi:hypothetical protein